MNGEAPDEYSVDLVGHLLHTWESWIISASRLREEAVKKRDAEYAACLHDIEQRKILNELIKREILADIEHKRMMNERGPESWIALNLGQRVHCDTLVLSVA